MSTKAVVRFRREAETAAKLHHTNIVPVHATGEENGTRYYGGNSWMDHRLAS